MPAYFIARVRVTDPTRYEDYKNAAEKSIAAAGGRYVIRGGASEAVEGEADPRRLVVLEFPDAAAARAWYDGPAYTAARKFREGAAEFQGEIVEGL